MQKIRIDFDNPGLPQHISAVENDSQSRVFQATLYENGKAYTAPEGATYSIMYRGFGPQNQGWYDTINDGAGKRAACAVSGNVVTCEIARQALQVPGHVSIVLCVTTGKGYMLKSWPIECDCKNDRYDSTAEIQSFFYVTNVSNVIWMQAIQAVEELKNTIDPTLSLSGKAADAAKVGEAVGQLKEDLVKFGKPIIGKYVNLIPNDDIGKTYTIDENVVVVVKDIESSYRSTTARKYLLFTEITITSLNSFSAGRFGICLNGIHVVLPEEEYSNININIENNKTYYAYSIVDVDSGNIDDYSRVCLRGSNLGRTNFSFTIDKLYMFEIDDLSIVKQLKEYEYANPFYYINKEETNSEENIDCWGDSLTQGGSGGVTTTYPMILQALINENGYKNKVNNMGVGGETTRTIAFRQGSNALLATPEDVGLDYFEIPESNKTGCKLAPNMISLKDITGRTIKPGLQGYAGINPCYFGGVKGFLYNYNKSDDENGYYYFAREKSGHVTYVSRPTQLITDASINNKNRIIVIMMGHNGGWDSIDDYVAQIKRMIEWNGSEKFIVCGIPSGSKEERRELEARLLFEFGRKFLNTREYICEYGLYDNALTPTQSDLENMALGVIPPQLRVDSVHFTEAGNTSLAKCIFNRLEQLGYLSPID